MTHASQPDPALLGVTRRIRGLNTELELYIHAAGRENTMHRTDLMALSLVMDESRDGHAVTPGGLSTALQLSAPATSAMLDRLERDGHVRRIPHATDRRSVVIELTDHAWHVGGSMFRHLGQSLIPALAGYSEEELTLISQFLERVTDATREARASVHPAQPAAPDETVGGGS